MKVGGSAPEAPSTSGRAEALGKRKAGSMTGVPPGLRSRPVTTLRTPEAVRIESPDRSTGPRPRATNGASRRRVAPRVLGRAVSDHDDVARGVGDLPKPIGRLLGKRLLLVVARFAEERGANTLLLLAADTVHGEPVDGRRNERDRNDVPEKPRHERPAGVPRPGIPKGLRLLRSGAAGDGAARARDVRFHPERPAFIRKD